MIFVEKHVTNKISMCPVELMNIKMLCLLSAHRPCVVVRCLSCAEVVRAKDVFLSIQLKNSDAVRPRLCFQSCCYLAIQSCCYLD